MDPELPQYARSSTRPRDPRPSVGSSSSGSRRNSASRAPSEHSYHLTDSKGRQWLSLKVISNAPSSGYLPAFYEGDAIGGSVSLHREKEDSIKSISVQVLCSLSSVFLLLRARPRARIQERCALFCSPQVLPRGEVAYANQVR